MFPNWQLHRGYWKSGFRENTLEAFKEASKSGCEMIEMDVQWSQDRVVHVYHDFDLKRFFKVNKRVDQVVSEDLVGLNIPRLSDVLQSTEIPQFLNIEIKSNNFLCFSLVSRVAKDIERFSHQKVILLSSFNPICLFWSRFFSPLLRRALIVGSKKDLLDWKFRLSFWLSHPDYLNVHFSLLEDPETDKKLKKLGCKIMVWTVNDEKKARSLLKHRVVSVISDYPLGKGANHCENPTF